MLRKFLIIISMLIVALIIITYGKNTMSDFGENNTILIYNQLSNSSAMEKNQSQLLKKTYYDTNYNIIEKGLFWENRKIIYIENGKQCFDLEKEDNIGINYNYSVKVDADGNTTVNFKKKQNQIKNGNINIALNGKKTMKPIKGMYFDLDYSKNYGFCDGELFLLDKNGTIIEDYKNEFHEYTLIDSLNEIKNTEWADGANMPEDRITKNVRFDFKGEMNIRPQSETYYFDDNHSLAYDGVKIIDGKKYFYVSII